MIIYLHNEFVKAYKKLTKKEQEKFKKRRDIFLQDEFNPLLNNHPLKGKYQGYRSINIAGDLRAIYKHMQENTVIFVTICSHSKLYG